MRPPEWRKIMHSKDMQHNSMESPKRDKRGELWETSVHKLILALAYPTITKNINKNKTPLPWDDVTI